MKQSRLGNMLVSPLNLVLFVVINLYSIMMLQSIFNQSQYTFLERVISTLSDPYLFIYGVFPIWIILINREIIAKKDDLFVIRLRNHLSFSIWLLGKCFFISISLFTPLLLGSISSAFGGSLSLNWGTDSFKTTDMIVSALQKKISSPLVALVLQMALLLLFFMMIAYVLITVGQFFQKTLYFNLFVAFVLVYLMITFTVRVEPVVFNLSIYARLVDMLNTVYQISCAYFVIICCCVLFNTKRVVSLIKKLYINYQKPLYFIMLVLLCGFTFGLVNQELPLNEYLIAMNYGASDSAYTLISIAFYLLVYLGIPYMYLLKLDEAKAFIFYELIRRKRMNRWFLDHFLKSLQYILGYLLLVFLILLITSTKNYLVWFTLKPQILYQFFVNGFLQLSLYQLIILFVFSVVEETKWALYTNIGLVIFLLPFVNFSHFLPIGLNGMGLLEDKNIYHLSLQLISALLVTCSISLIINHKRGYKI